jgi:hypothetical protein
MGTPEVSTNSHEEKNGRSARNEPHRAEDTQLTPYIPDGGDQRTGNGNGKHKSEKATHKDTSGRVLKDRKLERYQRIYRLQVNVVTQSEQGKGKWVKGTKERKAHMEFDWDISHGGIIYKEVGRKSKYEDKVAVTITEEKTDKGKKKNVKHTSYFVPVRTVKPETYRFHDEKSKLQKSDTIPVKTYELTNQESDHRPEVGLEFEAIILGELGPLSDEAVQALATYQASTSPECLRETTEVNFGHDHDLREQGKRNLRAIQTLHKEAKRKGKKILPVSMYPYAITQDHENPHPYVQGLIDVIGRPNIFLYGPSNSQQITVENYSYVSGRKAYDLWTETAELVAQSAYDSTVAFGQVNPNLYNIIATQQERGAQIPKDEKLLKLLDYDTPLSTRKGARSAGSLLGGGNAQTRYPVRTKKYLRTAEIITSTELNKERTNFLSTSPTIDRVGGEEMALHHGDMRYRRLIGPRTANEYAAPDTAGGELVRITVMQEYVRKLNELYNRVPRRELHRIVPDIFSSRFSKERVRQLEKRDYVISTRGAEADIRVRNKQTKAATLSEQLIALASKQYNDQQRDIAIPELPPGIVDELKRSIRIPTEDDFRRARGTEIKYTQAGEEVVVPSIGGWYGDPKNNVRRTAEDPSGIGNPASWRRARIIALQKLGLSEAEILADYIRDGEESYARYLEEVSDANIDALYEQPSAPTDTNLGIIYRAA